MMVMLLLLVLLLVLVTQRRGKALVITFVFLDRPRNIGDGILAYAVFSSFGAAVCVSGTADVGVGDVSGEEPVGDAGE